MRAQQTKMYKNVHVLGHLLLISVDVILWALNWNGQSRLERGGVLLIHEGADRVRGRWGKRGREGEVRGGRREKRGREEGVGGGRRGGGRRERGERKGGRGKEENFARAAPRREEGGKGAGGGGKGAGGGEAYPPVHPLIHQFIVQIQNIRNRICAVQNFLARFSRLFIYRPMYHYVHVAID